MRTLGVRGVMRRSFITVRRYRLLYSTKRLNRPPNVDLHGYLPVEAMSDDGEFVQESDQTGGKSFPGLRDARPFRRRFTLWRLVSRVCIASPRLRVRPGDLSRWIRIIRR